jgi:hypothetical protein
MLWFEGGVRYFSGLRKVQNDPRARPASYSVGIGGFLSGCKADGTWSWILVSILYRVYTCVWSYNSTTRYVFVACRGTTSPLKNNIAAGWSGRLQESGRCRIVSSVGLAGGCGPEDKDVWCNRAGVDIPRARSLLFLASTLVVWMWHNSKTTMPGTTRILSYSTVYYYAVSLSSFPEARLLYRTVSLYPS